jgi:hypothetical protein
MSAKNGRKGSNWAKAVVGESAVRGLAGGQCFEHPPDCSSLSGYTQSSSQLGPPRRSGDREGHISNVTGMF